MSAKEKQNNYKRNILKKQSLLLDFIGYIDKITTFARKQLLNGMDERELISKLQNSNHKAYEIKYNNLYYKTNKNTVYHHINNKNTRKIIVFSFFMFFFVTE